MFWLDSGRSRRVRTYQDFVRYIKQLADKRGAGVLSTSVLDFEGKNMVLLWRPIIPETSTSKQIRLWDEWMHCFMLIIVNDEWMHSFMLIIVNDEWIHSFMLTIVCICSGDPLGPRLCFLQKCNGYILSKTIKRHKPDLSGRILQPCHDEFLRYPNLCIKWCIKLWRHDTWHFEYK